MTKTLIDIDDELLARAMRATGESTKKATVNRALIGWCSAAAWTSTRSCSSRVRPLT